MHLLGFKLTVNPCEVFSEAMPCLRYLRDILSLMSFSLLTLLFLRTRLLHHRLHAEKSQIPAEKQAPQQVHGERL